MTNPTPIAGDFPLLVVIVGQLRRPDGGSELEGLRAAGRLLREAFHSIDHGGRGDPDASPPEVIPRPFGTWRDLRQDPRQLA